MTDTTPTREAPSHTIIAAQMQTWITRVVVGLNLCPFARKPLENNQVRITVSNAHNTAALLEDLHAELSLLESKPASEIETTVIAISEMLGDFADYNDFLDLAEGLLDRFGWEGQFQIASFHPDYQFDGTGADDAENYTNRSPWPALHLLREDSLEQAVDSHPDPEQIPDRNIAAMNAMGQPALAALLEECRQAAVSDA
ncbi:DUF1415 domain-containing protein [Alcanivorax limicola]|uniref:DUF1415 domain-containing protein n=1 Tax=Alcanivorax limicola TaxID=2874102 RepID=UPI001CBE53BB|nr:DUF1415 domain-containing protein [Alcanivorax limicola]